MDEACVILTKRIKISGVVQGVGFRPFIYRMAKQFELVGEVSNSSSGVDIVVSGVQCNVDNFIEDIPQKIPPLAHISSISVSSVLPTLVDFKNFSIVKSRESRESGAIIPPDISTCDACLDDVSDSKNRRYRYPFTNCTNCGPRYTILMDVPYDRKKTSMKSFRMCSLCQTEYSDPGDRRFHAQPNACPTCGPSLCLTDSDGNPIESENQIAKVSGLIREGNIIAIKGIGGFHLTVDATNNAVVEQLRKRKHREDKPFAVMSSSLDNIRSYAFVRKVEAATLSGIQRPIVLLGKVKNYPIAKAVSPNNSHIGVMLPYTPLHNLLFSEGKFLALVMTSANLSGEPIITTNQDALKYLNKIADYFLMHNRDILTRSDDSVLKYYAGSTRIIRRSRGYVPLPIDITYNQSTVLACGAEKKNTICLTRNKTAFMSQHIGNLQSKSGYNFFLETIDHMCNVLKVQPDLIACDYHPDYMSTRYVSELKSVKVVKVQHHHAHIVACTVENKVSDPVIGLAFDGTGLGDDNTIWGGEVLISSYSSYNRVGCLEPVPMPGSSMAIYEPWRMAVSYLYKAFGMSLLEIPLPILVCLKKRDITMLISMIRQKINTPYTSSLGRFFDGIAAIVGIRNKVSFEGQSAMELESLVTPGIDEKYSFDIASNKKFTLTASPIVEGVVYDVLKGVYKGVIAAKFHNTIISMFVEVCLLLKKCYNVKHVALSGGVFQNSVLTDGIKHNLEKHDFKVLIHRLVPCNDGGISLGQAIVAQHSM